MERATFEQNDLVVVEKKTRQIHSILAYYILKTDQILTPLIDHHYSPFSRVGLGAVLMEATGTVRA